MDIKIRKAEIADAEKIAKIKIEGWQTAYREIIDSEFLDNMDINTEIEKRKTNLKEGVKIIVAELEGEVVGYCIYRDFIKNPENFPNEDCELSALYVKSMLRGKGIGTILMKYVTQELKKQGKTKMILGCLKENYPSRAFYEKKGGIYLKTENFKIGNAEYEEIIYKFDISKM